MDERLALCMSWVYCRLVFIFQMNALLKMLYYLQYVYTSMQHTIQQSIACSFTLKTSNSILLLFCAYPSFSRAMSRTYALLRFTFIESFLNMRLLPCALSNTCCIYNHFGSCPPSSLSFLRFLLARDNIYLSFFVFTSIAMCFIWSFDNTNF